MAGATLSITGLKSLEVTACGAVRGQATDLVDRVRKAAHRSLLFQRTGGLQRELAALDIEQLRQVVEQICLTEDSPAFIDRLAGLLPLERLEEMIHARHPEFTNVLSDVRSMLKEAEHYLVAAGPQTPTQSLKTRINNVIAGLLIFIDSMVDYYGIADLFKPKEHFFDSDMKAQKIFTLISLFSMVSTVLIPLCGAAQVAYFAGILLVSICVLSLALPYIRPALTELPEGKNWTKLLRKGLLGDPVVGRKKWVDQVAATLSASQGVKAHPLLIGKSGAGKTDLVKAFVQALERGDYPDLKGKEVHYYSTADLVQHRESFGGGNPILRRIGEAMWRHKEKYILVLNEIHYALKEKENSAIGEQLKDRLDDIGEENFPYVIGVTTEEEYSRDIYSDHSAFARRFSAITVGNTDPKETVAILGNKVLRANPQAILDPEILPYLVEETTRLLPNVPQPLAALTVLMKCLQAMRGSQEAAQRVEAVRSQIEALYAESAVLPCDQNAQLIAQIRPLEERLRELEAALARENECMRQILQFKDRFATAKKTIRQRAIQVARSRKTHELVHFALLKYFAVPSLECRIRDRAAEIRVPVVIDKPLVDRMIREEVERLGKVKEARERGRQDLQSRAAPKDTSA